MGRKQDDIRLTPKQKKLLAWIKIETAKDNYQPNYIDMAGALDMSVGSVQIALRKAEALGYIKRGDGKARSIKFLKEVK